jgi:hypothetical protein
VVNAFCCERGDRTCSPGQPSASGIDRVGTRPESGPTLGAPRAAFGLRGYDDRRRLATRTMRERVPIVRWVIA